MLVVLRGAYRELVTHVIGVVVGRTWKLMRGDSSWVGIIRALLLLQSKQVPSL
jgi:hypothetical protein